MEPSGERDPSGVSRKPVWTEAVVLGAVLSAILAVLLGLAVMARKDENLPPPPPPPGPPPASAEQLALKTLEKFFEGADLEEKLPEVRDPARVRPMMEDYHLKRGHPFPTMGRVSRGKPVTMGARQLVLFEVEPFSGPKYPVAVEWDGFRYAVDWESLTAYGTMDWTNLVEKKPETAQTVRVYLGNLPDSLRPPGITADRQAFRVEHRDSDVTLPALAGPELSRELAARVKGKRVPLTVEIVWDPGAALGGAFRIQRLVSEGWSR